MSSHGQQHILSGAQNVAIHGGIFATVGGNMIVNSNERPGLNRILARIAEGASHDAAERGDPPRCHPHTRIVIREEILEWIKAPLSMRKLILWMYGPAGSGKTAIAQTIAEACKDLGILAASFFFWRSAAGRNDASRFVATLAYQLSRHIPEMKDPMAKAIEDDPAIFSLSLSTQMRALVIAPLKLAAHSSLSKPTVAIVDGIDECGPDGRSQSELVCLLGSVASELQHLPLVFLITSRPEYEIREAFNGNLLNPLTKVMVLDNSYKPDQDIKLYFESKFGDIYEQHRRLGHRLPSPWPTASNVHSLISKASGQFIFAATVTKFIGSYQHNPADRMNIILRLSSGGNETPFALLDALYRFVLDSVADIEKVLDILAFLLLGDDNFHLDDAEELLGIEFRGALVDMHSLLDVPPPSDNSSLPSAYHASLEDFLMDRSRSREYYIGTSEGHLRISRRCLNTIGSYRHFQFLSTFYVVRSFIHHTKQSPPSKDLVNDLAQFNLRAWLDESSDLGCDLYDIEWEGFFDCVKQQTGVDRLDIFLRLQKDLNTFILDRIAQYPPSLQAHIPTLLCCRHLSSPFNIFTILLHGASISAEEYKELLNLDKRLLHICKAAYSQDEGYTYVSNLFKDRSRVGEHFVDGGSYAALAKAIVRVVCSRPGERNYGIRFEEIYTEADRYLEDDRDPTMRLRLYDTELSHFRKILEKASTDWELAKFFCERAVQYRNDVEPRSGRRTIAQASIRYIQRCEIPFLEHSHQSDTNECAICTLCEDAIVIENIPNIPRKLPPPLSPIEDVDFILAATDALDGTAPYLFTHRLKISEATDGDIVYSFVRESLH